jgi:hypothetical protein
VRGNLGSQHEKSKVRVGRVEEYSLNGSVSVNVSVSMSNGGKNRYKGLSIDDVEVEEVVMVVNGDSKPSYAEMVKSLKEVKSVKEVKSLKEYNLGSLQVKKKSWADWSDSEDDSDEYEC